MESSENNLLSKDIEEIPPKKQTWWDLILYLLGGFGFFIFISVIVGLIFFPEIEEITISLTITSIFLNVLTIGGAFFVFGVLRNKVSTKEIGLWPIVWEWKWVLIILLATIFMNPIRIIAAGIVQQIFEPGLESLQARADIFTAGGSLTWFNFLISLMGIGILAPIAEELYFRGLIQVWFKEKYSPWIAVMCSSILFGLAHFDSPGVLVSSMIMGFVLGYSYEYSKSIWLPIGLHIFTNSSALVLTYLVVSMGEIVL